MVEAILSIFTQALKVECIVEFEDDLAEFLCSRVRRLRRHGRSAVSSRCEEKYEARELVGLFPLLEPGICIHILEHTRDASLSIIALSDNIRTVTLTSRTRGPTLDCYISVLKRNGYFQNG